jgi:ATP-dependent DNA helicase RecQ
VQAAAEGRDVLAVLPTGAGKSAIYALAGIVREGPTVVVSPLLALEDDQLAHLRRAGLPATVLNSTQSVGAREAALLASCSPEEFVFVSPEQLANSRTREALRRARPGLFAVDEAHLISQWGHDFRPDYLRLGAQADALGAPVRLALTATAAPPVRDEISRRLGLRDPTVVIGDFDRPHLRLSVERVRTEADKQARLQRAAAELAGAGIVYAATHAGAEAARDTLGAAGHSVGLYHAGLSTRERREAMDAFMGGSARVIAATVAFGMGIDKPDVRWVVHVDPPPSLDAYYQEIGRAGRDELPSEALLIYRPEDVGRARHLTARGVSEASVERVAHLLAAGGGDVAIEDLGLAPRTAIAALARLVDLGAAAWTADGRAAWTGRFEVPAALDASRAETEREHEVERSRLEMMRRYAEHSGDRRSFLLSYFGQVDRAATATTQPFPVGGRVVSERWGAGTVQRYDGDQVTVLFDEHGYRDLLVSLVVERGLLTLA